MHDILQDPEGRTHVEEKKCNSTQGSQTKDYFYSKLKILHPNHIIIPLPYVAN